VGRIESKEQAEAWLRYIEQSKIPVSQRYINELKRRAGYKDIDPMDAVVEQMEDMLHTSLFGDEDEYDDDISLGIPSKFDPNNPMHVAARQLEHAVMWGQSFGDENIQRNLEMVNIGKPMTPLEGDGFDGLRKLIREDDKNEEG